MKNNYWNDYEEADNLFESYTEFLETSEEEEHFMRMMDKGRRCKKIKKDWIFKWRKRDWPSAELTQLRNRLMNKCSRNDVLLLNYEARKTGEIDTLDILPAKKSARVHFPGWGWLY